MFPLEQEHGCGDAGEEDDGRLDAGGQGGRGLVVADGAALLGCLLGVVCAVGAVGGGAPGGVFASGAVAAFSAVTTLSVVTTFGVVAPFSVVTACGITALSAVSALGTVATISVAGVVASLGIVTAFLAAVAAVSALAGSAASSQVLVLLERASSVGTGTANTSWLAKGRTTRRPKKEKGSALVDCIKLTSR